MRRERKNVYVTFLFSFVLLAMLAFGAKLHPEAWRWYGIAFGVLGVWKFMDLFYNFMAFDPEVKKEVRR